jgi:dihydrofolate reductase
MASVIVGVTLSLDGFMADAEGGVSPLYSDLGDLGNSDYMAAMVEETGAVLMGRRTFEMGDADSFAADYEFQVPIFVVTHRVPAVHPRENERLSFTFVTDGVESAVRQAKAAARDKAVTVVGGADLARQLAHSGLIDELRIDFMPVLFGAGPRFFDGDVWHGLKLEKIGTSGLGPRTSLRFRFVK